MKKILITMVALLAMVTFASGVIAQAPAKMEKATAQKTKAAKTLKFAGAVTAFEDGKVLKVKGAKDKEMTFDVTGDTKMKGEVKEGAKVSVIYKKDGDKMVATSVAVTPPKKKAASKKEEKKM